jgi:AcrR family transcriptional regulator
MLDAAEDVVLRDGLGRLTLDAVARQANLSKGGLMHHFPTKDALVDAMVRRKVEAWRIEVNEAIEREGPGPGRALRAIVGLCLGDTDPGGDAECRRCFVLVAALVHDARHVEPLRAVHREVAAKVAADGLDPGLADAVHLAMNGLWFDRMFGLTAYTAEKLREIRDALLGVVDRGGKKQKVDSKAVRAKQAGTKIVRNGTGSRRKARR